MYNCNNILMFLKSNFTPFWLGFWCTWSYWSITIHIYWEVLFGGLSGKYCLEVFWTTLGSVTSVRNEKRITGFNIPSETCPSTTHLINLVRKIRIRIRRHKWVGHILRSTDWRKFSNVPSVESPSRFQSPYTVWCPFTHNWWSNFNHNW